MLVETPQIVWHGDAIHSCDFDPVSSELATAGLCEDRDYVRFWDVRDKGTRREAPASELGHFDLYYEYSLWGNVHVPINMLRFSPNGLRLGLAGDDTKVEVLCRKPRARDFGKSEMIRGWGPWKQLEGHLQPVFCMSWSGCSSYMATGSMDNTVIIWNIEKGCVLQRIEGIIRSFVNGVALDPQGEYLAIQSNDRTLRLYQSGSSTAKTPPRFFPLTSFTRVKEYCLDEMQYVEDLENEGKEFPFLHGEQQFQHFYHRLEWSPDGAFFLTTGSFFQEKQTAYLYIRELLDTPMLGLGGFSGAVTCIRFCPVKFKFDPHYFSSLYSYNEPALGLVDLEHAWVFAIATSREVIIFSSACVKPLVHLKKQHQLSIQDLAWNGAKRLVCVSLDGYSTVASFEPGLFGEELARAPEEEVLLREQEEKQALPKREEEPCVASRGMASKAGKKIVLERLG